MNENKVLDIREEMIDLARDMIRLRGDIDDDNVILGGDGIVLDRHPDANQSVQAVR